MPAIITHDFFGQDIYERLKDQIGTSQDEREAFLLGNQGPDPLFYIIFLPQYREFFRLGSAIHSKHPSELLYALKRSIAVVDPADRSIARAYALGFLCHYLLDSTAHPLIYAVQFMACDAGVPDLDRADGDEVHAVIERELDERLLFARYGKTVASFSPETEILRGSRRVLKVVSQQYMSFVLSVHGVMLSKTFFRDAVLSFRVIQRLFHSTHGIKRAALTRIELGLRRNSIYSAMSHRTIEHTRSPFENLDHRPWTHPWIGETRTDSFPELFECAQKRVDEAFAQFLDESFDLEAARSITHDINFNGALTVDGLPVKK